MNRRFWIVTILVLTALGMIRNPWYTGQAQASVLSQSAPWTDPLLVAENASAPVMVGDSSGIVHLFHVQGWYDTETGPVGQAIMYQHGTDDVWSAATDILVSPNGSNTWVDGVVIDHEGYLQLLWNDTQALYFSSAHITAADDPRAWQTSTLLRGPTPIADLAQDDTGILHVVVRSDAFSVSYMSLADGDQVWSSPLPIDTIVQTEAYAIGGIQLALSSPETIHVTWFQTAAEVNWNFWSVWYARSDDGGQTWSLKEEIATPRFGASDIAVDSDGNLHLVYGRNIGNPDGRWHQWSKDGGDTWSEPTLLFPQFESASGDTGGYGFATDSTGVLHMVNSFADNSGEATAYHLEWQKDNWSQPQFVMGMNPHFPRLTITLGNQLWFIAMANHNHELWTNSRIVEAPALEPVPVRKEHDLISQDVDASKADALVDSSAADTVVAPTYEPVALNAQSSYAQSSSVSPVLFGVAPALLLVIGFVVVVQLTKTRRRS